MPFKLSVGLWCLGGTGDRYNRDGYSPSLGTEETINMAAKISGISAIEMIYPTGFQAATGGSVETQGKMIGKYLEKHGLQVSSILVNTFSNPKWQLGSLGAGNKKTREEALILCKEAIEFADALNSPSISLWLGQDGFDYPFQIDYQAHWDFLVETIKKVALFNPQMLVSLEYKHREPRNRMTVSGAAKTLLLVQAIGEENVGVCMDFGHALACKENPGESVCLINSYGKLFNVHINDCLRDWDDDMIAASVHLPETLEFLYCLQKTGYGGWLGLDQFPYREDALGACRQSVENLQALERALSRMDKTALQEAQAEMNTLKTQDVVRKVLFS